MPRTGDSARNIDVPMHDEKTERRGRWGVFYSQGLDMLRGAVVGKVEKGGSKAKVEARAMDLKVHRLLCHDYVYTGILYTLYIIVYVYVFITCIKIINI